MRIGSCFFKPRKSEDRKNSVISETDYGFVSPNNIRMISYNVLKTATNNFSPANIIGRGGFGVVYKGILKDKTQVAVKSLSVESKHGIQQFVAEVDTVSRIRHPNLVRLLGYCVDGSKRILVYEYLENNSLANALLGPKSKQIRLDWPKRFSICMGTAHGLSFLHDEAVPSIVHRDIKASNILLDKELNPKIGDFGLAKLFPDTVTHIDTRVAGTIGYLAPEYALLAQLTKKADIYSFGVLLLEIVSGKSCSMCAWGYDMKVLVEWVWKLRDEDRLLDIVDSELGPYPEQEVLRFIKVALLCTQATSNQRPSMKQVVEMLSSEVELHVHQLVQPGTINNYDKNNIQSSTTTSPGSSSSLEKKGSNINGGGWKLAATGKNNKRVIKLAGNTTDTVMSTSNFMEPR